MSLFVFHVKGCVIIIGLFLYFQVQYFKRVDMFMPFEGYDPDNIKQKEVYGQKDHVLIIGLKPVTEYFARVQVWNSAGRGPKGEWRRSETRHAGKRYE